MRKQRKTLKENNCSIDKFNTEKMHNVTTDQIEKNKHLIALVKSYPQIYNRDPTQQSDLSVEEIWQKVSSELGESGKEITNSMIFDDAVC